MWENDSIKNFDKFYLCLRAKNVKTNKSKTIIKIVDKPKLNILYKFHIVV